MSLLATSKLTVSIGGKPICNALDMRIEAGLCWGLLGANGAGKTTLLHTLAGLHQPDAGTVLLRGHDLSSLKRRDIARVLGLLPQDHADPFPATVLETVLSGRHPHLSAWQWEGESDIKLARAALASVGLEALQLRQVDTLSGGERRRVAIATLLTQEVPLMLLDEPANHLDLRHQMTLLTLLTQRVRQGGGGMLMSLHDINLAARFCDRLLLLFPGGETMMGTIHDILQPDILRRLYGWPLRRIESGDAVMFMPQ